MKKLKSSLSKKLKGKAGESIAEVLIALLIAALALTMLASVITTAARTITRNKQQMDAYYAANEWLTAHVDDAADGSMTVTVTVKASTDEDSTVKTIKLMPDQLPDGTLKPLTVNYQVNDIVGVENSDGKKEGIPVVAFWKAG